MAKSSDRRTFLKQAAGLAGTASLGLPTLAADAVAAPTDTPRADGTLPRAPTAYHTLAPDEAAFVEALVDVMCPPDELTPSGVDCGLALGIDRLLASAWGRGEGRYLRGPFRQGKPQHGWQSPMTPEQLCKAGISTARAACLRRLGREFAELGAVEADRFLQQVQAGEHEDDASLSLAMWFNELVYPLFTRACFADPMYGGNRGKVFWKMIGYPGLPAAYGIDMVRYRGKPHPRATEPKSIEDLG